MSKCPFCEQDEEIAELLAENERLRSRAEQAERALEAADALLWECERWEREGVIGVGEMNDAIRKYRTAREETDR